MSYEEDEDVEVGQDGEGDEPADKTQKLTVEFLRAHLTQVAKTRNRKNAAFVRLELSGKGLTVLEGDLSLFKELRYIILNNNQLTSMADLNELPNMLMVDFRQNLITKFDGMGTESQTLTMLLLDNNKISSFADFNMPTLKYLSLAENEISDLNGLEMPTTPVIEMLNLSKNKLSSLIGFECLPHLKEFSCSKNQITSLDGMERCTQLVSLDVSNNQIKTLFEFNSLVKLQHLRTLVTKGNTELYEAHDGDALIKEIVLLLPQLTSFDGAPITVEVRIEASKLRKQRIEMQEMAAAKELADIKAAASMMSQDMKLDLTGIAPDGGVQGDSMPTAIDDLETATSTNIKEEDLEGA